ncbi:Threonine dehydratase [Caenispirillum salinarum AK4]|uniref:Threonine dehydratase n=1 Tax=Caenispirillum salinarum AK4 TaxID=1238182 RepID=K9HLW4_9PROT|nr:threonine dehydratase [Caenispirillum salinarum]EKV29541.1 Threonine dehydratase [Caenispirillum salinarum AK4]
MRPLFTLDALRAAADLVHAVIPPTPQIAWPLLSKRLGAEVWVKHENHTPVGAFKVRGGLVYVDHLAKLPAAERPAGVISATRGNHGQSLAFAGARAGLPVTIVVPEGNSPGKNAAMRALGAELVEAGADFDAAKAEAVALADARGLTMVPPFAEPLVRGVATYALELFTAAPDLDAVYVPVGCGSGLCGMIQARDLLGLRTEIIAVTAAGAPGFARSFAAGRPVTGAPADTMADGLAVRGAIPEALAIATAGAARVVEVTDAEIEAAMRLLFEATHNVAEGAGAAALAALARERSTMAGRRVAVVLTGGNVDRDVYAAVLGATDGSESVAA